MGADSPTMDLFKRMIYTKSKREYNEIVPRLLEGENKVFAKYLEKKLLGIADMFCESQTPPLFHGPSITTSPLEKLNDLIKTQIPISAILSVIVSNVETVVKNEMGNNLKYDRSRLSLCHHDKYLVEVQKGVPDRVF